MASLLIPPSKELMEYTYTYQDSDFPKQGYKYFDSANVTPVEIVYNGISTDRFYPYDGIERDKVSFLTICSNLDKRNYLLKGIDLFFEAAKMFPDFHFLLVGKLSPGFRINKTDNLVHLQSLPHTDLPKLMSGFQFYCQLSFSEGFGIALAEAMACGCVPIVSKVGMMDQIVGDSGFVLEKHDPGLLKQIIEYAVKADIKWLSQKAREQIVKSFTEEKRSLQLLNTISSHVNHYSSH
ncbi:MAG: glycosyltransferase [Bacteroidales bacterium]|jgi:glycosyltransferase involved in cell wall biosynthesis|nr:glycosyltransferase [Bacteroidales bacterium]